jgi:aminoglycoside phosphotransferase (APT) family kinase protein
MLLDVNRILTALTREFGRLQAQLGDRDVDGSASQAIANALQLLRNREQGDIGAIQGQIAELGGLLLQIDGLLGGSAPELHSAIMRVAAGTRKARAAQGMLAAEDAWRAVLTDFQHAMSDIARARLPREAKAAISRAVVEWESGDLLRQGSRTSEDDCAPHNVEVNRDNLGAYLRERFGEPKLKVISVQPLAGGFGKQTILFDVEGDCLSGAFVMRRDIGSCASVPNDCHLTKQEFPVIKAAFARGFPAPDALWLDTNHRLLPGGDFIVMRRSPGTLAGNFFGARGAVPVGLADALASVAGRLHSLPPLEELGELTDSIRPELWTLPLRQCIERYIRNWYELFLREDNTPSPALMGLYGWLLDNVPERTGRPVLLHGDIGFHNFLFDGDTLSAVLDWEFAHIGDPAEELGYIKVTVGSALDWDRFMAQYQAAGGSPVESATLRYFQVWAYVRNATGANLLSTLFAKGRAEDLKLAILPVAHIPHFLRGAQALIDAQ